jgi:hypothetical protein
MCPKVIEPYLWFSDIKKIDLEKDYIRIILNVLNIGDKKATDWLFKQYSKTKIKQVILSYGAKGELSDKSLNYWTLLLNINKKDLIKTRF